MNRAEAEQYISNLLGYALAKGREPGTWYMYHNHVYGVAKIAEKMAQKLNNLDPERAYILGLLHDAGKIHEQYEKRIHSVLGYEILKDIDSQAARIALTHTFCGHELLEYEVVADWFFNKREDYDFVEKFLKSHPADEYDRLIQLCDCLANFRGFVTLQQRADEFFQRHHKYLPAKVYDNIEKLKVDFEQLLGRSVYELFDEISNDFMLLPGQDSK